MQNTFSFSSHHLNSMCVFILGVFAGIWQINRNRSRTKKKNETKGNRFSFFSMKEKRRREEKTE